MVVFYRFRLSKYLLATILLLLCMLTGIFRSYAQTETFPTGSYIINMGITPQTQANGLKPYGLIYDLLKNNNVPIKWVISQTKGVDGVDFTYNGVQYKGGTFIIPAPFLNTAVNNKISSYGVTGTPTTSPLTVNVTYTLTAAPRWTLDDQNGAIAQGFFSQAGIPATAYNWKDPQLLAGCDDIFVMPHADPTWGTHSNLYNWNRTQFGAVWAGCHAVSVLENMNNGSLQTNFLATNVGAVGNALVPFGSHADGTPPYTRLNPNIAGAQYMGLSDLAHLNGSEQIFLPKLGGGWRPTTKIVAYDPTQADVPGKSPGQAAVIATGRGFGLPNAGWVMYEGGHDIKKEGGAASVAAIRAFFNFSFQSSIDKVPLVSSITVPSTMSINTAYPVSVTASSPVGLVLTYAWTSSCGGTFTNASAASTTFTAPNVGTVTPCIITCTITDACGRKTFMSQPVTINPVTPPAPVADVATIPSDCGVANPLTKNVLTNDVSPDNKPLTLTSVTPTNPASGTMSFTAAGNVTFTPNTGFTGTQVFNYTVCDNTSPTPLCANSTYTITVGSGAVPTAVNDATTIAEDNIAANINVLGNDTGTGLFVSAITSLPTNGKVSINVNNTITYIPNPDYAGTDVFTYQIKNTDGNAATATVTVTITNDACDAGTIQTGVPGSATVTLIPIADTNIWDDNNDLLKNYGACNDLYINGPSGDKKDRPLIRFDLSGIPSGATIISASLELTKTGGDNTSIPIAVHRVTADWAEGTGACGGTNGVANWINRLAATPWATPGGDFDPTPAATTNVSGSGAYPWNIQSIVQGWVNGTFTNYGVIMKFATENFNGEKKFGARTDAVADRPTLTITYSTQSCVAIPARAPLSMPDAATTLSNTAVTVSVLANDNNVASPTVTVSTAPIAAQGTAAVSGNNVIFTPNPTFNGTATFQYTVTTAAGNDVAVVRVQVNNTPVVANNDNPAGANAGTVQTINVKANDVDPEGAVLTVTILTGPANGMATVNGSGNIVYTPATGFTGTDVITYQVCEPNPSCGSPFCATATLTLTVLNLPPPVANNDTKNMIICSTESINLLANDTDPQGDVLTVTSVSVLSNPAAGTLVNNGDGTVTFTAANGFNGTVTFTYTIQDDGTPVATAGPATVTINVSLPTNTAPTPFNDVEETNRGQILYANVRDNDSDPNGNPLDIPTITIAPLNGTATVNPINGQIEYTPNPGYVGTDVLTYRVCDIIPKVPATCTFGPDLCATATLTITVLPPAVEPFTESGTVSSATGGIALTNIASNDKINGLPAILGGGGNATVAVSGIWPAGITLNPTTGAVSVVAGTTPGVYLVTYTLCNTEASPICEDMVDQITVTPSILPVTESVTVSSVTGGTMPNIASNDQVNGFPATLGGSGNATVAIVGSWPAGITLNTTTGVVTIAAGTTPGVYPVTYKLCDKLTPQNCADMVDNITVTPSIVPVTESVTVSSATGGTLSNIANNDQVNGLPATLGGSGNATVAIVGSWPAGITLNTTTGVVTIAAGTTPGVYPVTYKLCDKLTPQNCADMVDNITVTPSIVPVTESVTVSSATGGTMPNIASNDQVNGLPATLGGSGNATVAIVGSWPAGITLNTTTGVVTIAAGTTPGVYPVTYKLCDKLTPQNCADMVDNITVTPSIVPVTESVTVSSATGGTMPNIASNDQVNGLPATLGGSGNATVAIVGSWPAGITLNTTTGVVTIAAGTTPGVYPVTYKLCDKLTPQNCADMVDNITVTPSIVPVTESVTVSSVTGGTLSNIANNDQVNGLPATLGGSGNATVAIVGSWPAGITLNTTTGVVTIAAGTTPGVYPVTYKLCDKLTPQNCADMVDNITVTSSIVPVTESVTVSSATGGTLSNIANNDQVNGLPATLGGSGNATVAIVGSWPAGITLNTTTGVVTIAAGTTPGVYPVTYKLCDKLTPQNCADMVDNITVTSSIVPVTESVTVSSVTGGTMPNIASNDQVNGLPATLGGSGNATVAIVGSWPAGITLNTTTGVVTIAAGTTPGVYPVTYKLCDKLTPQNCADMVDNITVTEAKIKLIKSIGSVTSAGPAGPLGDVINYTFTVSNTGNVPLTGITISDPLLGANLTGGPISLAAGVSDATTFTGTYTITQADINVGGVQNTATATGTPPSGPAVTDISDTGTNNTGGLIANPDATESPRLNGTSDTDPTNDPTVLLIAPSPSIKLIKSISSVTDNAPTGRGVGDVINYTFTFTNTGNVSLSGVNLTDAKLGLTNVAVSPSTLSPGVTGTATATYTITQADVNAGGVENTATVTGTPPNLPDGTPSAPVTDVSDAGTDGNAVVIADPDNTESPKLNGKPDTDPTNDPTVLLLPQAGSIKLIKSISSVTDNAPTGRGVGDVINYTFTVTNTGNVTLSGVSLTDAKLGLTNVAVSPSSIAPGLVGTATATYTITQADVNAGGVENTATVTGTPPNQPDGTPSAPVTDVSDAGTDNNAVVIANPDGTESPQLNGTTDANPTNDPTVLLIAPAPQVRLVKTAAVGGTGAVGDMITYTFTVTNTGNVTLSALSIADPKLSLTNLAVTPSTLLPNGVGTATATYTITQADLNAGEVKNTATVTGTPPSGPDVIDVSDSGNELADTPADPDTDPTNDPTVVPLTRNPQVKLVKLAAVGGTGAVGDVITYTFTVTNTGNVTLTNLSIDDVKLSLTDLAVSPSSLAPNAVGTATATYTITQADLNAGEVKNTATVTGTPPSGPDVIDVSDSGNELVDTPADPDTDPTNDPTVVPLTRNPQVKLVKLAAVGGTGAVGDVITYTFTVTNTGNVTLTNLSIDDVKLSLTDLAVSPSSLAPNAVGTATATYTITQADLNAGEVKNTATVTGTPPSGPDVIDVSDSGNELADTPADPDTDPTNDPTVVPLTQNPKIGVSKTVASFTNNYNGTFDVTFSIMVKNMGNVPLSNVQVFDNLSTTFPSPATTNVLGISSAKFTVDPAYTGTASQTHLLLSGNALAIGESGSITLSVRVTPNILIGVVYNNIAYATGQSPLGDNVEDQSQLGNDPDPDFDLDPKNNSDPTPITLPGR